MASSGSCPGAPSPAVREPHLRMLGRWGQTVAFMGSFPICQAPIPLLLHRFVWLPRKPVRLREQVLEVHVISSHKTSSGPIDSLLVHIIPPPRQFLSMRMRDVLPPPAPFPPAGPSKNATTSNASPKPATHQTCQLRVIHFFSFTVGWQLDALRHNLSSTVQRAGLYSS